MKTIVHVERQGHGTGYAPFRVAILRHRLDREVLVNPDFAGSHIEIEMDWHTWVDCADEIAGATLLHTVVYPTLMGAD